MEVFSNSVITVLLGWVKGVCGALYDALTANGNGGLLGWMGRNWIVLTIFLLLAGTAIDLTVYFLRWRPVAVWKSYFRRIRRHREEAHAAREEEEAYDGARMVWADGSSAPLPQQDAPTPDPVAGPVPEYAEPEPEADLQPVRIRRADRYKEGPASLLKKGLRALSMNDDPDDGSLASSYKPQMNTDRSLTFHAPVYPQQNEPEDPDKP